MARCIDLFIDRTETDSGGGAAPPARPAPWEPAAVPALATVAEMAAELTALTGLRLTEEPDARTWVATVDGARVVLAELAVPAGHDLVDGRHPGLSSYRYDLFARVPTADANSSPEAVLLRRVLALVKADARFRAVLVWDLQNIAGAAALSPGG